MATASPARSSCTRWSTATFAACSSPRPPARASSPSTWPVRWKSTSATRLAVPPSRSQALPSDAPRLFRPREAIEFTVAHDDGKRVEDLAKAEDCTARRLARGQDAAEHVPVDPGLEDGQCALRPRRAAASGLDQVDPHKVVGLVIEPVRLMSHRRCRASRSGIRSRATSTARRSSTRDARRQPLLLPARLPRRRHDRQTHRDKRRGDHQPHHAAKDKLKRKE